MLIARLLSLCRAVWAHARALLARLVPGSRLQPSLEEIAQRAARKARDAEQRLQALAAGTDAVSILGALGALHLTAPENAEVDIDEITRWQVKLEYLTWLLGSKDRQHALAAQPGPVSVPLSPELIGKIEETLEDYYQSKTLETMGLKSGPGGALLPVQHSLLVEGLHVRGEGTPEMIRFLARGLYGAHSEWFIRSLGFTIEDAIAITEAIFVLGADRLTEAYARGHGVADQIEQQYQTAAGASEVGWSDADRQLVESVRANGLEYVVAAAGGAETFSDIRSTRGFTSEELTSRLDESLALRVPAFLKFFSANFGELPASPDPLALNPLTQTPLLVDGDRFFAFVPPLLWEAVLNGPHFALIRDSGYRAQYDDERAAWLEQQANSAFARLWPKADIGWSVTYGPKTTRCELDGIVVYGRKVVLLECKWKTLTVSARQGAADALTRDITQSIKASFDQARRARDYIRASTGDVVFTDPNGAVITVDSRNVNEIVLLSVLGRGALSTIAANPLEIKALGFFGDGELPGCVPSLVEKRFGVTLLPTG